MASGCVAQGVSHIAQSNASYNVGPRPEFRYDIVVKNKTPVFEQHITKRNTDQFHRMIEKVKMAEIMITGEQFLPNDEGMFCKNCPFQSTCKTWHRDHARVISIGKEVKAAA